MMPREPVPPAVSYAVAIPSPDGQSVYQLRLPQFEGPLDVLLNLIERRELEITAISVATVAEQFLDHVAALDSANPQALAEFVSLAARLVLIKSRALLPRPPGATESDDEEFDDAAALARQLADYRQARATALALAERLNSGLRAYDRPAPLPPERDGPPPLAPVSLADLTRVMRRRLLALPVKPTPMPSPRTVSLEQKIVEVEAILAQDGRASLSMLLERAASRLETIVTFIALLELIRRRRIIAVQPALFGEIEIEPWREPKPASADRD